MRPVIQTWPVNGGEYFESRPHAFYFISLVFSFLQLRGFPPEVKTKAELVDIFTRLIWTATAQHTAVNYPIAAYGAFTPNMPTKLYDDDRVAPDVFNPYRLPNGVLAAVSRWFYHFTHIRNLCCCCFNNV